MSIYDERPWLSQYAEGKPADIEAEHTVGLEMFRATVQRHPDGAAIHYFDSSVTYRELDEITYALSAGLLERGLTAGDRIAVYLQNVPQFVMAMVAAWKAGAIMVSINPMLKSRELTTLLTDSGARALVALESLWRDYAKGVASSTD